MSRLRLLALALLAAGCGAGAGPGVRPVTLAELEAETRHLPFFHYTGSDERCHYFATREGRRYRLDRSAWELPRTLPAGGGVQLFVTVRDGRITAPDPKVMAEFSEHELLE